MARPAPQTVLAFDYGTERIGVALGNSLTGAARPLAIVATAPQAACFARIGALIREWGPDRLLVGRPTESTPQMQEMSRRCERFVRQLHGRFGLPVDRVDERYSTYEAQAIIGAGQPDDAVAAAVILEQYFDEQRNA